MCQKFILSYCQVLFHYVEKTEFGCPFTIFFFTLFIHEREREQARAEWGGGRQRGGERGRRRGRESLERTPC